MTAPNRSSATSPRVTFFGAARSVTGSMHLVEVGPHRILLDCGLHRGPKEEVRSLNRDFPFDPSRIDAVILSHAHIDHCGNLPNLVRQGFRGPIYCTPATRDLIAIMLADSARIQEDDAQVAGMVGGRRHHGTRDPLYTRKHTAETIHRCVSVEYETPVTLNSDVELRLIDSGHLLGSAMVHLRLQNAGREFRLTFTGDLGRRGLPYLRDPAMVPGADLIVSESTYGGKTHDTVDAMAERIGDVVRRTVARSGKVLIPAFSLGRTQIVVHYLRRWMASGILPRLPIYIDSPLAADIDLVHEEYSQFLDADAEEIPAEFVLSNEEALWRSQQKDPCVIVASGGMCEGGRIVAHLKHQIDDPRSSIVLVSYQAPGTVGAQLMEKTPQVRFHGRTWNKWIEVTKVDGFSGHADQVDLRHLLANGLNGNARLCLVHGELSQSVALAGSLKEMGIDDVTIPGRGEVIHLGTQTQVSVQA